MKVSCTKKEKEGMIRAISDSIYCPFVIEGVWGLECPYSRHDNCEDCLEERIEWEIKGDEQE